MLLAWLQSSADPDRPGARPGRVESLRLFADDRMNAVWGTVYDAKDLTWWNGQYDEVVAPCFEAGRGRREAEAQARARAFAPFRSTLMQAFTGLSGGPSKTAIRTYVQQTRQNAGWVSGAMPQVDAVEPTFDGFEELVRLRRELPRHTPSGALRSQLEERIVARQRAMAPALAEEGLRDAEQAAKTVESARAVHFKRNRPKLNQVLAVLAPDARAAWQDRYAALLWSLIAADVDTRAGAIDRFPRTMAGLGELSVAREAFERQLGEFRWLPRVEAIRLQYTAVRRERLAAGYQAWEAAVRALPLTPDAIDAKSRELALVFVSGWDEPEADRYSAPLRAREVDMERALGDALPLTPLRLKVAGLDSDNGRDFRAILTGDFAAVTIRPQTMRLISVLEGYALSFGRKCAAQVPPDRMQMKVLECTVMSETRNQSGAGMVVGAGCARYAYVDTGIFAARPLYEAVQRLRESAGNSFLAGAPTSALRNPEGLLNALSESGAAERSVRKLVENNTCEGRPLKRFGENLLRFAQGAPPLTIQ